MWQNNQKRPHPRILMFVSNTETTTSVLKVTWCRTLFTAPLNSSTSPSTCTHSRQAAFEQHSLPNQPDSTRHVHLAVAHSQCVQRVHESQREVPQGIVYISPAWILSSDPSLATYGHQLISRVCMHLAGAGKKQACREESAVSACGHFPLAAPEQHPFYQKPLL